MRDCSRIETYAEMIRDLWELYPDWRFSQFLYNTLGGVMEELGVQDLFYVEDEDFFAALNRVVMLMRDGKNV